MEQNKFAILLILLSILGCTRNKVVNGQLPDEMQRELNQNLAEQARIQAIRQQHQNQIKSRQQAAQPRQQVHDPNNYSYQQVSPPIQYSYYQPFGDAVASPQQQQQQPLTGGLVQQAQPVLATPRSSANSQANNFDFNNLNFDLPKPQAQVSRAQTPAGHQAAALTPSFVGVGGLPVMQPIAGSAPAPLAPQARVQQGPPLSEADFRDITGGENYGAPGGQDFGLGDAGSSGDVSGNSARRQDNTDAQLREFGFPGGLGSNQVSQQPQQQQQQQQQLGVPDFGAFGPIGLGGGTSQRRANTPVSDEFGGLEGIGGNMGNMGALGSGSQSSRAPTGGEFDFALQPSQSQQSRGNQMDPMSQAGGAPGSLQGLLGAGFPGLGSVGGGTDNSGLDSGLGGFGSQGMGGDPSTAMAAEQPQQRSDPTESTPMDIADLGERSDQFSNANLGNFGDQLGNEPSNPAPSPRSEPDFDFASSNEQPSSVPYPDSAPQPVGSLLAITQPQSLTQTRYSALPDKGTYQGYPAYAQAQSSLGYAASTVGEVVDRTPAPRPPGNGRYGRPSYGQLAPEYRHLAARQYDYSSAPLGWYY